MNRIELRQLAEDRILDAAALLAGQRWSGAFYLAGYAVECGLKACILARVDWASVIFEEPKNFQEKCWSHKLDELVRHAGLEAELKQACTENAALGNYWNLTKGWAETSRYQQKTQAGAELFYTAITHTDDGILTWIRTHW